MRRTRLIWKKLQPIDLRQHYKKNIYLLFSDGTLLSPIIFPRIKPFEHQVWMKYKTLESFSEAWLINRYKYYAVVDKDIDLTKVKLPTLL